MRFRSFEELISLLKRESNESAFGDIPQTFSRDIITKIRQGLIHNPHEELNILFLLGLTRTLTLSLTAVLCLGVTYGAIHYDQIGEVNRMVAVAEGVAEEEMALLGDTSNDVPVNEDIELGELI